MKKRILIAAIALVVCLSLAGNVLAFTNTEKTLKAYFSGIQIMVDGEKITPHDVDGNYVEPFIVDGTTYLPVRAVGEALGKVVGWDGETRTVSIGVAPGVEAAWKELNPYTHDGVTKIYDGSVPTDKFTAAGTEHTNGIVFNYADKNCYDANIIFNTNGLYKTMTFTIVNYQNRENPQMIVTLGDEVYETYQLKWDDAAKTFTIPVNYAPNVKIALKMNWDHSSYAMYDISFEK